MAASAASDEPLASVNQFGLDPRVVCAVPIALAIHIVVFHKQAVSTRTWALVLPALLAGASFLWLSTVARAVPEPYLDEVFHIPQAQRYCDAKFSEWDDKITTPPGLYLLSVLLPQAARVAGLKWTHRCDANSLRVVNTIGLFVLACLALACRRQIEARMRHSNSPTRQMPCSEDALHTSLNIALFPLLFFFSGLYYTDVISTAVVVGAYLNHLGRVGHDRSSVLSDILTIGLGVLALLMRQTNVFWIVIYMGGLEAVHAVKTLRPKRVDEPRVTTLWEQVRYFARRYSVGDVHDEASDRAWPADVLLTATSLMIAAICNLGRVFRQVWPYVTVLAAFAAFVAWNRGVVLGDKSNHVATVHLAQMLYIWPFFAFFSMPLLLSHAIHVVAVTLGFARLSSIDVKSSRDSISSGRAGSSKSQGASGGDLKPSPESARFGPDGPTAALHGRQLMGLVCSLGTLLLSYIIVRYNTIVHPFTLADNRHYMFYVFRYTIRRAAWIRYVLIVPYTLSRWAVWGTMVGCRSSSNDGLEYGATEPVPTSTALMFLIGTTLSLVTAPLVEPRYFIIPWVMWRLLVPEWRIQDEPAIDGMLQKVNGRSRLGKVARWARRHDLRLVLETAWFVAINLVTCYTFLAKPFVWKAEDGRVLDSGRLQRFMW